MTLKWRDFGNADIRPRFSGKFKPLRVYGKFIKIGSKIKILKLIFHYRITTECVLTME